MIEVKIFDGSDLEDVELEKKIAEFLNDGWELKQYGVGSSSVDTILSFVFVRKVKPKEDKQ